MATNKQVKCPVCGEGMRLDDGLYRCDNKGCPIDQFFSANDILKMDTFIQSRIDKAVQEERERVINILELAGKKWDWTDGMRILIEEIITGATK